MGSWQFSQGIFLRANEPWKRKVLGLLKDRDLHNIEVNKNSMTGGR
jgi:hypothetical protein